MLAFGRKLPEKGGLARGAAGEFLELVRTVDGLQAEESVHCCDGWGSGWGLKRGGCWLRVQARHASFTCGLKLLCGIGDVRLVEAFRSMQLATALKVEFIFNTKTKFQITTTAFMIDAA